MGFYIRKAIKAGPFRFNLSKSGLGVSTGVPGFRVGTGPRGNYVHLGRHGVYYRTSLGGGTRQTTSQLAGPRPTLLPPVTSSSVPMEDLTGVAVAELAQSSPSDLVAQLQAAANRISVWP